MNAIDPEPETPQDLPARALAFWVEQLRGAPGLLELPTDRPRPAVQGGRTASLPLRLDDLLGAALQAASRRHGVPLCTSLLAGWAVLLACLSGQADLVIGTLGTHRSATDSEPPADADTQPRALHIDLSAAPTVSEWLAQVHHAEQAAHAHPGVPLARVVDALKLPQNASHAPLFQALFAWQTGPAPAAPLPRVDLTLELRMEGTTIAGALHYAVDLFDPSTIERHAAHWTQLLRGLVDGDTVPVTRLPLLSAAERTQIVNGWNATALALPAGRCIHELFEQQVVRTPTAPALAFGGGEIGYAELNARANQLARHLVSIGVRPDARVAIALPRGPEMVVAVLATLKAGGAYVPMDLGYPADRLAWMREDSAPVALITRRDAMPALGRLAQDIALVELDAEAPPWADEARANLDTASLGLSSSHLAYVIYTSGSTGRPKGVMIEHAGLCSLAVALIGGFGVRSTSRVLQLASFSFDACISEIVMALCCGATLCLPRPGALVGRELREVLDNERISHATIVPSVLATLPADARLPHLQTLVVAGEAVGRDLVERWAPGRRMVNAYGPTEATVCASMQDCDPAQPGSPGIGRPIANTRIYLLDGAGEPVPIGVVGELHIGGGGVARGYLNRPELSAERFVPDPLAEASAGANARMYKTGDLARWRPDGNIEFLGRNDHQVKIRGLRIELGEIEAAIAAHPAVRQVAVLAREDAASARRLVAYVASDAAPDELLATLRSRLRVALPEHMMPAAFVLLEQMPMTPNGKLDRQALPAPAQATPAADATAPRDAVEQSVWAIWCALLGHDAFGVLDNFFDAGGDSLRAVELHARLEEQFKLKLPVSLVLEAPTAARQAALLQQGHAPAHDALLLIRPGTSEPAVFFVHDGFGETLVYRQLAQLIAAEVPVYGLQPVARDGIAMPHTRVEEIAAAYVAHIQRVQPRGPYLLAGLCAGGVIAFEMARQLQAAGQTIGMLALMDANDVAARRGIGRFGLQRIQEYSGALGRKVSPSNPVRSIRSLVAFAAQLARLVQQHLAVRLAHARGQLKARVLRYCLDRGRQPPAFVRSLSVDQIYALAESSHVVAGPFDGELLLFRASAGNGDFGDEPYKNLYTDPLLGWGQRVRGQVKRVDIGGGHYSMFQAPHVQALARTLQPHIDAARQGASGATSGAAGPRQVA